MLSHRPSSTVFREVVTRLLIVDDHRAIAEGLRALIDGAPDILVVGTAYDAPSARALISQFAPDVVLCDMRLGDPEEGLDLPEEGLDLLSAHVSDTAFIMLSAHTNPDYVVTAVVRGARGYLSKMASLSQIVDAVRVVASGGESFGDEAREAVGRSLPRPTPQEYGTLRLLAQGRSYAEIACSRSSSVRTVESQIRRMFFRYAVPNRVALVRLAQQQGWIDHGR